MPAHPLSDKAVTETIQLIEECLEEGFTPPSVSGNNGAIAEAKRRAVARGITKTRSAFETRLQTARERGFEPDWTLYRAPVYQKPEARVDIGQYPIAPILKPSGKAIRVGVIGDAHDDPRLEDKSRFKWIGQWCADGGSDGHRGDEFDYIVQIGDWATLDSMNKHAEKGSQTARLQPTYKQDLDSLEASVAAFHEGLGEFDGQLWLTTGNHELRAAKYEEANPDLAGSLVPQWQKIFTDRGWRIKGFGEYVFIDGIGFVHHPINGMGRAYGGKTGNVRAGADTVFSIVHGHDHKLERVSSPKIGPIPSVDIISVGCSLPWGWVEPYAKLSPTGWWWGVVGLTIQDGQITDMDAVSMLRLQERYEA